VREGEQGQIEGSEVTDRAGNGEERRRNLQSSGDELRWPDGSIWRGCRGETEREAGASYRRGLATYWAGIDGK
jgi:hypothetical protein